MKISVFGLGYVGAVSLACLSRDGHDVTGVDIDDTKLQLVKDGMSPIVEKGILELMAAVVASGRVCVTSNAAEAITNTEISFFCVGTPSLPNGDQDLNAMNRLSEQVGDALKSKTRQHTIVIRSTVQPGTVKNKIVPILEKHSGKKSGVDFFICFQPEFLREGSSIKDYDNPPMTVLGVEDDVPARQLEKLFGHLPCELMKTDIRTAETLKYACNTFHALKITFANEMGRLCQALGADSHRVMSLLCADTQLNISSAYLRPGFAFGGSCLPKDLRALLYMAKRDDVDIPMLSSLLPSNRIHVEHALDFILQRGSRSIGVIGLSFKSGTDDLRESPMVDLVEKMIGKGLKLKIYDPEVRLSRLIGANKKYIDEAIPHIGELMCETIEEVVKDVGVVIVGLQGDDVTTDLCRFTGPGQYVLDLVGIDRRDQLQGEVQGVCW